MQELSQNPSESRGKWMKAMFKYAGLTLTRKQNHQFWQYGNHPIPLWSEDVIWQKLAYINQNPVRTGWVAEPWHYLHSSARAYNGMSSEFEVDLFWS